MRMFPTRECINGKREREENKLLSSFDSDKKMSLSQKSTLNHKDGEKEVLQSKF